MKPSSKDKPQIIRNMAFRKQLTATSMLCILIALLMTQSTAQTVPNQMIISQGSTQQDGMGFERAPSYYTTDGTNGIRAGLDGSRQNTNTRIDYFIRMWIRPQRKEPMPYSSEVHVFLEIPQTLRCSITYSSSSVLGCQFLQTGNLISQNISGGLGFNQLAQPFNTWLSVSLGGSSSQDRTYLRIDLQDQLYKTVVNTTYQTISQVTSQWYAYLGITEVLTQGFKGDMREFLFTQQYIAPEQVGNIKNQVIYWKTAHFGNYRLQKGDLKDFTRPFNLEATLVGVSSPKGLPIWQYDSIPLDMCQAQVGFSQIPYINSDNTQLSGNGVLDSRVQTLVNFAFSGSFWMKTYPGIPTTNSPQVARDGKSFFEIGEVVAIWFNDPTSIRLFFHSSKQLLERASNSIFFPLGQWANFQFTFDRLSGYDMRVFDVQRRQIAQTRESIYLSDQLPNGQLVPLRNFRGFIKQIMIYNVRLNLPIDQTNGNSEMIEDNSLILYYKFDQQYFNGNQLQSLAQNSNGVNGKPITFNGPLSFETQIWDTSYSFSNPSQIGTLTQPNSLYDGLACQKFSNPIYRAQNSATSKLTYQNVILTTSLTQGTIEMWFKRLSVMPQSQENYLFSLYHQKSQKEYFNLYVSKADGILTCSPFANTTNQTDINTLKYRDYAINATVWQHVYCKFETGLEIAGSILRQLQPSPSQRFYSTDISKVTDRSLTMIPAATGYTLVLGNRFQGGSGQTNTYFRDVRFWTSSRTILQLDANRYLQIDPTSYSSAAIMVYFKLTSGDSEVANFVSLFNNNTNPIQAQRTDFNLEIEQLGADNVTLCPQFSYYRNPSFGISRCFRNPFKSQSLLVLPFSITNVTYNANSSYMNLNWEITSNYSEMISSQARWMVNGAKLYEDSSNTVSFKWNVEGASSPTNQAANAVSSISSMYIDSQTTNQSKALQFKQSVSNKVNSFFSSAQIKARPHPCQFVSPSNTSNHLGVYEEYLTEEPGTTDRFLKVYLNDLCPKQPWNLTQGQVQPLNFSSYNFNPFKSDLKLYPMNISISGLTEDRLYGGYTIKLDKNDLAQISPYEQAYLVGTFFWSQDPTMQTINGGAIAEADMMHHVIYKLKYIERYSSSITLVTGNQTLIGEDLVLDGSLQSMVFNSTRQNYSETESRSGLACYWECPPLLQPVCDAQKGKKILTVVFKDFDNLTSGSYDTPFIFKLRVFKATDPEVNLDLLPSSNVTVTWLKVYRPKFSISIDSPYPQVLASQDMSFRVSYENYDFTNPNLSVIWNLTPNSNTTQLESPLIVRGKYGNILTLLKGALSYNKAYNLTVQIQHVNYSNAMSQQSLQFSTGVSAPVNGTGVIAPKQGNALDTMFTLGVFNWNLAPVSDPNSINLPQNLVKFTVKGVSTSDPTILIPLSDRPYYQQETLQIQLPMISSLVFEVFSEQSRESAIVQMPVSLTLSSKGVLQTLPSLAQSFNASAAIDEQQRLLTQFSLYSFHLNQLNTPDVNLAKTNIVSYLSKFADFSKGQSGNLTSLLEPSSSLLSIVTSQGSSYPLSDALANQSQSILNNILSSPLGTQSPKFFNSSAQTLSNLLIYYSQQASSQAKKSSRLLQSISMSSYNSTAVLMNLLKLKEQLASVMCQQQQQQSISESNQVRVDTPFFELLIERINSESLVFNRSYSSSKQPNNSFMVPAKEMVRALNQTVCVAVTYFKVNPLDGWKFENQTIQRPDIFQLSIYGAGIPQQKRILRSEDQYKQHRMLQMNQTANNTGSFKKYLEFQTQYSYNYNASSANFKNNQTVIENIQLTNFTQNLTAWSFDRCNYTYEVSKQLLSTRCLLDRDQLLNAYNYGSGGPLASYSYFFALVTDTNRIEVVEPGRTLLDLLMQALLNFDPAVISILIFLLAFNIVIPFVGTWLDKKSYEAIGLVNSGIPEDMLKRIAQDKKKPVDMIVYNRALYAEYYQIQKSSCCTLFSLYFRKLHPIFGIIGRFDVEFKRLTRFMLVSFQISIIAIIFAIIFSYNGYRASEQEDPVRDQDGMDDMDLKVSIIVGAILSLLTLPLPSCFSSLLRSKLVIVKPMPDEIAATSVKGAEQYEGGSPQRGNHDADGAPGDQDFEKPFGGAVDGSQHPKKDTLKFKYNSSGEVSSKISLKDAEEVVNLDGCLCCKLILVILTLLFSLFAILFVAFISSETSTANAQTMTLGFFISILLGYLVLNTLRIALNALYVPSLVDPSLSEGSGDDASATSNSCGCTCCCLSLEAIQMLKDLLLVYKLQAIASAVGDSKAKSPSQKGMDNQLRSSESHKESVEKPQKKIQQDCTDRTQIYEIEDDEPMRKSNQTQSNRKGEGRSSGKNKYGAGGPKDDSRAGVRRSQGTGRDLDEEEFYPKGRSNNSVSDRTAYDSQVPLSKRQKNQNLSRQQYDDASLDDIERSMMGAGGGTRRKLRQQRFQEDSQLEDGLDLSQIEPDFTQPTQSHRRQSPVYINPDSEGTASKKQNSRQKKSYNNKRDNEEQSEEYKEGGRIDLNKQIRLNKNSNNRAGGQFSDDFLSDAKKKHVNHNLKAKQQDSPSVGEGSDEYNAKSSRRKQAIREYGQDDDIQNYEDVKARKKRIRELF